MTSEHEREQLVAHDAVVVVGAQQQRHDVLALDLAARPAVADERVKAAVDGAEDELEQPLRLDAAHVGELDEVPGGDGRDRHQPADDVADAALVGARAGWPSMPKMPAMITSSVTSCMRGASAKVWPGCLRCRSRGRSRSR